MRTMQTQTARTRTPTAATLRTRESALARCIEPTSAAAFLAEFWERKPLPIERAEEGRYDDLLSAHEVERQICSGALRYPAFRLVSAERRLDPVDYTEAIPWRPEPFSGSADVGRVVEAFDDGATIVLQGLHLHSPPLASFCRELEVELGESAQANAYYTPRDSQGLPVHHDTHEVFVLQVSGTKRWLVYEPVLELPLPHQRYREELGAPGASVLDITLRAGDTLYLPRGWLHQALTSDTDSLHLTIGVKVYTWLDAFKSALDECENDVEFRRSVSESGEGATAKLEQLGKRLDASGVVRRKRMKFVGSRRPILEGQLTQLRLLDHLAVDTPLERRPTAIADVRTTVDSAVISFEDKNISLPARVHLEVNYVLTATGQFCASDLPGDLDDDGRLVFVRRLIREGLLRIVSD